MMQASALGLFLHGDAQPFQVPPAAEQLPWVIPVHSLCAPSHVPPAFLHAVACLVGVLGVVDALSVVVAVSLSIDTSGVLVAMVPASPICSRLSFTFLFATAMSAITRTRTPIPPSIVFAVCVICNKYKINVW